MSLVLPPPKMPLPDEPPGDLLFAPATSAPAVAPIEDAEASAPEFLADGPAGGITVQDWASTARAELQVRPPSGLSPSAEAPDGPPDAAEVAASTPPAPAAAGEDESPATPEERSAAPPELPAQSAPVDQEPDAELHRVRGETVRMRRAPSLSAPTVALFATNDEMRVDRREGEWSHVTAPDGRSGWMATEYLSAASGEGGDTATSPPAESPAADFIVDTVAPPPPDLNVSPESGVTAEGITNRRELVLAGRAEAASLVTVRDGEAVLGAAPANDNGDWRLTVGPLSEGNHSITATAADPAGNASGASTALAVTLDTEAPTVALAALKSDTTDTVITLGGFTNDNTPTLSGTAEAGSSVEVILRRAGSPEIVLTPTLNGNDWSVAPSAALPDGPYTVTVKATDRAGNVAETSAEVLK